MGRSTSCTRSRQHFRLWVRVHLRLWIAQWQLLETSLWVNIQRITGAAHCAKVVWTDLAFQESIEQRYLRLYQALISADGD